MKIMRSQKYEQKIFLVSVAPTYILYYKYWLGNTKLF